MRMQARGEGGGGAEPETPAPSSANAEPRLRRTFTLPRNPFGRAAPAGAPDAEKAPRAPFRRPSWRRFLTKLAHRVNSVTASQGKQPIKETSELDGNRVPPWPPDRTPGATGIRNHGNTCFMNAVLQCLSHTDIIAEYFVLDQYKVDLSRRNKLNSKKFGTRGEVTEQLALILKALWACQYYPELSTGFKAVVERHGSQYRGSSQHDAQEFLLWLLDKVHEDLNTATKKKYKTIKNTIGRPDEVVAAETLANHIRCNSSFVQAVFQAQFRSSLACPRCHRQSNTFDPFHCISVQLPHLADHPLLVTVVYVNQQPRCVRLGVRVSASAAVRELRTILTNDTGIPSEDIILVEVTESGFARTLSDCQPVWAVGKAGSSIEENSPVLYCIEAPRLTPPAPTEPPAPYVLLLWLNLLVDGDNIEKFGSPYIMQISRETGYEDLQKLLLKEMANMVAPGVLTSRQEPGELRIRIVDPAADQADPHHYLLPELEHPLYTEAVEQALALCGEKAGPVHLKLLLEWEKPLKERLLIDCSEVCEQHSSVNEVMQSDGTFSRLSLSDCLSHYTRAETLAMEDAWRCPQCQQYLPVVKTLGLWSLPDILVIHLKRFRQQQVKGKNSTKLTTMVDFPLYNFDMTPHLANKDGLPSNPLLLGGIGWSPWKKPRKISTPNDNTYDLYAVCYHHGNDLETGHYTAACKNPYDQHWYKFDDTRVTHIPSDNVTTELINNSAYILFYQKKHGNFVGCNLNNSIAGTSSVGCHNDHWAARMPKFTYLPKKENSIEKNSNLVKQTATSKPSSLDGDIANDNIEEVKSNFIDTAHLRASTTSLQDAQLDSKDKLTASPTDEKNLRNSISLSDNLRISTSNMGTIDASDIKIDVDSDNLINRESLFTMGESRRNTLSDYRNNSDEFPKNHLTNETIHRNSISLIVDSYLHNKDIHVNPKMTTIKTVNIVPNTSTEKSTTHMNGDIPSNYNFNQLSPKESDRCQKVSTVRTSMYENSILEPSPLVGWLRGEKGYSTLRSRHCVEDLSQKDHHSDDEAPPARSNWMTPSSLRRPVVFGTSSE